MDDPVEQVAQSVGRCLVGPVEVRGDLTHDVVAVRLEGPQVERVLIGEGVVDAALAHTGPLDQVVHAGRRVAVAPEPVPGSADNGPLVERSRTCHQPTISVLDRSV